MRREAEVVVRREIHDLAAVEPRVRLLLAAQDAETAVEAVALHLLERVIQELERIGGRLAGGNGGAHA
jgi:hypothetical protein